MQLLSISLIGESLERLLLLLAPDTAQGGFRDP
jgi:hypothetical protein